MTNFEAIINKWDWCDKVILEDVKTPSLPPVSISLRCSKQSMIAEPSFSSGKDLNQYCIYKSYNFESSDFSQETPLFLPLLRYFSTYFWHFSWSKLNSFFLNLCVPFSYKGSFAEVQQFMHLWVHEDSIFDAINIGNQWQRAAIKGWPELNYLLNVLRQL